MHPELILAINSGHGKWWYGVPVIVVVLIVRVFLRGRGFRGGGGRSRWGDRDDGPR